MFSASLLSVNAFANRVKHRGRRKDYALNFVFGELMIEHVAKTSCLVGADILAIIPVLGFECVDVLDDFSVIGGLS